MERERKLNDLKEKAENLEEATFQFQKNATQLKKKMWWEETKVRIGIGAALALVIVIVIIVIITTVP